ncbi:hypothetical protein BSPWISOX_2261 [uncultured Gammaproteobacteria bacterium]|nr:hypothetical protein BSPWISOX_2261 [uncultured Gammaproteobacteria bacterium]
MLGYGSLPSVSVAGCLGYDVLVLMGLSYSHLIPCFSCWLFRL